VSCQLLPLLDDTYSRIGCRAGMLSTGPVGHSNQRAFFRAGEIEGTESSGVGTRRCSLHPRLAEIGRRPVVAGAAPWELSLRYTVEGEAESICQLQLVPSGGWRLGVSAIP